jgi:hypothetical protein
VDNRLRIRVARLLLLAAGIFSVLTTIYAQTAALVTIAPPPLPVYEQPLCPADGYLWTPGYWAWDGSYYWVPGTWVPNPQQGFIWTPPYWSWGAGGFSFHEGYWSPSVGFYGGIDYGFGYLGFGFQGGHWESGHFDYNMALSRVDTRMIHHVYNTKVSEPVSRVSYNGGPGGVSVSDSGDSDEESAANILATHIGPVGAQIQHAWLARNDPKQRYSANHGTPPLAATALPLMAIHPKDLPPVAPAAAPDQKYRKEQDKLVAKQTEDRENLQKKQDKEDLEAQQKGNPAKTQQLEKQHQQQTQDMAQRHELQMKQLP